MYYRQLFISCIMYFVTGIIKLYFVHYQFRYDVNACISSDDVTSDLRVKQCSLWM